jgi:hypothetical protein
VRPRYHVTSDERWHNKEEEEQQNERALGQVVPRIYKDGYNHRNGGDSPVNYGILPVYQLRHFGAKGFVFFQYRAEY